MVGLEFNCYAVCRCLFRGGEAGIERLQKCLRACLQRGTVSVPPGHLHLSSGLRGNLPARTAATVRPNSHGCSTDRYIPTYLFVHYLHCALSSAVYCNRPCLYVCLFVCGSALQPTRSVCVASERFIVIRGLRSVFRKQLGLSNLRYRND